MTAPATISELITAVSLAIENDAVLTAWCNTNLGGLPLIYEGVVAEVDPPAIGILGPSGNSRSDSGKELVKQVIIGLSVNSKEITATGRRRIATGLHQVETMRELVEDAIFRAKLGAVSADFAADQDVHFPLFITYTAIELRALKTTRRRLPGQM